jgi:hypothetical protein
MSEFLLVAWLILAASAVIRAHQSWPEKGWFHNDLPWRKRAFWLYRSDWRGTVTEGHVEKVLIFRRRLRTMLFVLLLLPPLTLLLSLLYLYATL